MRTSTAKWLGLVLVGTAAVTAGLAGAEADLPKMDGVPTAEAESVAHEARFEKARESVNAKLDLLGANKVCLSSGASLRLPPPLLL